MYERQPLKTVTIPNWPKRGETTSLSITDVNAPYVCPSCHNTDHPPGARFCYICGLGFPMSRQPKSQN